MTATDLTTEPADRRMRIVDGRVINTKPAITIGVKSFLAALESCLDSSHPSPPGYVGVWNVDRVDWRPVPADEAEQESMLDMIIKSDPEVIPAGTDITPPCTPTAWYFLHPETDEES